MGLGQFPLALQHFGNDAGCTEHIEQIDLAEIVGIHQMAKHVDRIACRKRIFLFFEFFDQKGEQLGQSLLLCRAFLLAQQLFEDRRAPLVFGFWCESRGAPSTTFSTRFRKLGHALLVGQAVAWIAAERSSPRRGKSSESRATPPGRSRPRKNVTELLKRHV